MFDPSAEGGAPPPTAPTQPQASSGGAGVPVHPMRLARAVGAAWRRLALLAIVGALLGAVLARTVIHRQFIASSVLVWEGIPTEDGAIDASPRLFQATVEGLKLPSVMTAARGALRKAETLERFAARLEVISTPESDVVSLKGTDESAEASVRLVDAVVEAFLSARIRTEAARRDERVRVVTGDLERAREALAEARAHYNDFRRTHGVVDLPAEREAAIEAAASLRSAADVARADADSEEARAGSLRDASRGERPTTVLSETETRIDAVRLAEAEAELTAARARLGDVDPRIQARTAQVEALRERVLDAGSGGVRSARIVGRNPQWESLQQSIIASQSARASAMRRHETYARLAADARARLDALSAAEGIASAMLAAVHTEEAHVARLAAELDRVRDAARHPVSGYRVLSSATAPTYPSKSLRKVVVIAVPMLFTILGLVVVIVRTLRGMRCYAPGEVAFWVGGPVVASSAWPREAELLVELAEDLRLLSRDARGETLVVPASEAERAVTAQLVAAWTGRLPATPRPALAKKRKGRLREPAAPEPEAPVVAPDGAVVRVWEGALSGPSIRRAGRSATRVVLVVSSGAHGGPSLRGWTRILGRERAVGAVVVGLGPDLADHPDRVGDAEALWRATS